MRCVSEYQLERYGKKITVCHLAPGDGAEQPKRVQGETRHFQMWQRGVLHDTALGVGGIVKDLLSFAFESLLQVVVNSIQYILLHDTKASGSNLDGNFQYARPWQSGSTFYYTRPLHLM